jgi:DNA-directed RNA polymerase subunit RPC12/RpoP
MITHYEVLGIKGNATSKEIKKAHKTLALCLHPDKNVGVNEMVQRLVEERFLEVQEAYETLSDDARRSEYDAALAALRSEGEYYIPVASSPAAPNPPVKRKEAARCDKCQTIVGEPMHYICEGCRKEIAVLEKEVKARRQLGVTACRLCGCKPLVRSPLSGVCLRCWGNIVDAVRKRYAEDRLVVCPQCGRIREAGRDCPRCSLNSVGGGTWWSWKQSVAGMWKPAAVWSIVYLVQSLSNGHWIADFFITLALFGLYLFIKKKVGQ